MRVALFYPSDKGGVSRRVREIQSRSKYDVTVVHKRDELEDFDIIHSYADSYLGDVHTCATYLRQSMDYLRRGSRYTSRFFMKGIRELYNLRKFEHIISRSKAEEDFLARFHINSTLIRAGVDADFFMPTDTKQGNSENEKRRTILFVGRLEEAKGLRLLLKALDYLTAEYHLVIIGDGPLRRVAMSHPKVSLCNWVSHKDIVGHYQTTDVFCLPSYTECFPLSILEAMACNVPIITTDIGDITEMIKPPIGGYICKHDPRDIALKIQEAWDRKDEFNGRKLALQLPWSRTVDNVERVWEKII